MQRRGPVSMASKRGMGGGGADRYELAERSSSRWQEDATLRDCSVSDESRTAHTRVHHSHRHRNYSFLRSPLHLISDVLGKSHVYRRLKRFHLHAGLRQGLENCMLFNFFFKSLLLLIYQCSAADTTLFYLYITHFFIWFSAVTQAVSEGWTQR